MSYIYRFWHTFRNPSSLTFLIEKEEEGYALKGYRRTIITLLLLTVALFATRDIWGMYTFRLTEFLGKGQVDLYIFARYMSLFGAIIVGIIYFYFHYIIVSYIISLLTDLPYRWIQKVQLYVIAVVITLKFLEFMIFAIVQYTTIYSPFSFAAIAAQFITDNWTLFFINQLSIGMFLTVVIQYIFLVQWDAENKRGLLMKLIAIQLIFAIAVASISISPLMELFERGLS